VTADNIVVVPHRPGPRLPIETSDNRRGPDDLDALVDGLFPEVEERAGWVDATLAIGGAGFLAWAWIGSAPTIVTVLGIGMLALGGILPLRAAWRRARRRRERRRRETLAAPGCSTRHFFTAHCGIDCHLRRVARPRATVWSRVR
jgi:hypothetical protein